MASSLGPPRGQVTREQKWCLEKKRDFLLEELDGKSLLPLLRRDNILEASDEDQIRSNQTRSEQNRVLLDIIMTRTSEGFEAFMRALSETRHERAVEELHKTLRRARQNNDEMDEIQEPPETARPVENWQLWQMWHKTNAAMEEMKTAFAQKEENEYRLEKEIADFKTKIAQMLHEIEDLKKGTVQKKTFNTALKTIEFDRNAERSKVYDKMRTVNSTCNDLQNRIQKLEQKLDTKVDKDPATQDDSLKVIGKVKEGTPRARPATRTAKNKKGGNARTGRFNFGN